MTTKQIIIKSVFALLAVPCFSGMALAQIKDSTEEKVNEKTLSNVVITGQYSPRRIEDAVQRVRVIGAKKIAAMGAQNLRDVLLNETNISIAQDNVLGSSVSIQGITGQNVKILIDGVPIIGRQSGNVDLSQLNVYNVDRIELIEGPMSVNYGTDALAGTINIITKSSVSGKIDAGINTYTETIGKYNVNANVGFNQGKHNFILSGSRNFFSGWDPKHKPEYLNFGSTRADSSRDLQWDTKEEYNANFQYGFKFKKTSLRFKSDYFFDIITNRGAPLKPYGYTASDDIYKTTRFNNAVFANGNIFKNKTFTFLAAFNQYKREKNTYAVDLTSMNDVLGGANDQDTTKYTSFNSRGTIASSNAFAKFTYELGYDFNYDNNTGKRILGTNKQIGDYAVYGSSEYKVTKELTARIGLRYAYNTAFTAPVTPSLNLKYTPIKDLTFRGSYSRGFRSPDIKELYFEFKDSNHDISGNPNLTPEESDNFSIAGNYSFKAAAVLFKIEGSAFFNDIRNMISLAQTDTTVLRFTYINVDRYKTKGIQANFSGEYKNFMASLGGTYTGRYNQLSQLENSAAATFSYAPEMRFNVTYELKKYNTTFSAFSKYTGAMPSYGLNANNDVILTRIDAYTMADFSVSKKILKNKLGITLGCKNIFNTININRMGSASTGSVHSVSSSSVSISTGRSYFLGLGYQFSK